VLLFLLKKHTYCLEIDLIVTFYRNTSTFVHVVSYSFWVSKTNVCLMNRQHHLHIYLSISKQVLLAVILVLVIFFVILLSAVYAYWPSYSRELHIARKSVLQAMCICLSVLEWKQGYSKLRLVTLSKILFLGSQLPGCHMSLW
jgi:hypothetical protein